MLAFGRDERALFGIWIGNDRYTAAATRAAWHQAYARVRAHVPKIQAGKQSQKVTSGQVTQFKQVCNVMHMMMA